MGAATINAIGSQGGGRSLVRARYSDLTLIPFSFTMSTSYATGGDTGLTLPTYKDLLAVSIPSKNGYNFQLDIANSKIMAYTSGGTETTATTNLSLLGAIVGWLLVRA